MNLPEVWVLRSGRLLSDVTLLLSALSRTAGVSECERSWLPLRVADTIPARLKSVPLRSAPGEQPVPPPPAPPTPPPPGGGGG